MGGHDVATPFKHNSPETHIMHWVESAVNLKPGLQMQSPAAAAPADEVKLTGQACISSAFPPGQYEPLVQMGHGLVPDREPFPKNPGAHRHWFWELERTGLSVLLGHWLFAPAMHHELAAHWEHRFPSR